MGTIGLVIVPLLAGFVFAYTFHFSRYWLIRKQGYELLFAALLPGWIVYGLVQSFAMALSEWLPFVGFWPATTINTFVCIASALTVGLWLNRGIRSEMGGVCGGSQFGRPNRVLAAQGMEFGRCRARGTGHGIREDIHMLPHRHWNRGTRGVGCVHNPTHERLQKAKESPSEK